MTLEKSLLIMKNEKKCVIRAENCDRKCENCNLVMDSNEIIDAYNTIIDLYEIVKDTLLTDSEHRILLSAMSRELKICKEFEKENPPLYEGEDPHKLEKICYSIENKINRLQKLNRMVSE